MRPEVLPVAFNREFRDTHSVLIRFEMFCHDIHRDLSEIEIGADAARRGDAGTGEHTPDKFHCEVVSAQAIGFQVRRNVDKHFVNRVHMDIFGCDQFKINLIDFCTGFNVLCHLRRCDHK